MNCRRIESLLETHVDGELSPGQTLDVEAHLDHCSHCAEQASFMVAMKGSTRRVVQEDADISGAFLARLESAMLAEEDRRAEREDSQPWYGPWRSMLPALAMAAGVLLWFVVRGDGSEAPVRSASGAGEVATAQIGFEGALDRLIDYHSSPPLPQVTEARLLPTFEPNVGVRIRAPQLDQYGATWEGASLVPVEQHQAAYMRYRMPGHRVTVYVYDPRKVAVHRRLERRLVGNSPIYVGEWRGYSVAARENSGVGYAMTADLDAQAITQLISSIH